MSVKEVYEGNISEETARLIKTMEAEAGNKSPFEFGDGVDSAVLKTTDTERINTASGDWSVAMGSRNEALGKECFVVGGLQ